ncbi:MAG: DNA methylase N-4 [Bradyrhizobiaceae bacterium]|uniref:site-specific DNA-methyltransferase n=2 Tax=Bacilli TaxID=91061 RepID=UPI000F9CFAF8|nr:MAG: DNA methylase N-4 [Bradyrhizobiaceae bacterium]
MSDKQDLVAVGRNSVFLQIKEVLISDLKPRSRNARIHPDKQIFMLARNIDTFGFLVPCVIDEKNQLLTGAARVMAAERLGMKTVPVIRVSHLSDAEKRGFVIADNKLAETAIWDPGVLGSELQFFSDLDINFDFSIIGFETAEIDVILQSPMDSTDDLPPHAVRGTAISRSGDVWNAGPHRIFCGDALAPASYDPLLGGERAQLVFTDAPYNVSVSDIGGAGSVQHPQFAMASGEMTPEQFTSFLAQAAQNLAAHTVDGSLHYICMDWRHCQEILTAGNAAYSELKNICVWRKTNAGMGSLYRSQHEFVFVFKNGSAAHINNINLGAHGRNRSNVWDYAGINSFGQHRDELLAMHPTVKPVAMIADIIRDASARGDIVLDIFGGSGSTLIAAEKTKRRSALIEIDPFYVDIAIRRWQALTGKVAVCANSGATFTEREAAAFDCDRIADVAKSDQNGAHS